MESHEDVRESQKPHQEVVASAAAEPEAEIDRPQNGMILGIIVATLVGLFAIVIGLNEFFRSALNGELQTKVNEPTSAELRELRAAEQDKLNRYRWVNQKDGVVRVPIERAIELTLADYRKAKGQAKEKAQ
jgi:hypothetical protein